MRLAASTLVLPLLGLSSALSVLASSANANADDNTQLRMRMRTVKRAASRSQRLQPRQTEYAYIVAEPDPVTAAQQIQEIPYVPAQNSNPDRGKQIYQDDNIGVTINPESFANVPFVPVPDTPNLATNVGLEADDQAWGALPDLEGFTLNRTWEVYQNHIMPFYVTNNYQPGQSNANIQRAIIALPGKPRDSWKYSNLFRNARTIAAANQSNAINADDILVVGPAILNQNDKQAGAVRDKELFWHGSQWQRGGNSRNEDLSPGVSTYQILDNFTDWLFLSGEFPNLKQVVIGGHSMGAQTVQRYASLKKQKSYDPNLRFWVANPGSWAWMDEQRPYTNASCENPDSWPYGLGDYESVTRYARLDVKNGKQVVVDRFRGRRVHYALGLLDTGAGDTHCEALLQGGSHLDRGSQFVLMLNRMGGFPATHTLDVIDGVSHQDYPMMIDEKSLNRLFVQDYATKYPDITDVSNPGDKEEASKPKKLPGGKKSFDTPVHEITAWSLLGGSLGLVAVVFTVLPWVFRPNANADASSAYGRWETESKRKLL